MTGPVGSGGPRPGELSVRDRDGLVAQFAEVRRSRDWTRLAGSLVRARGWGVRVAVLSAVLGANSERVRAICRDHGPDPAVVGDLLSGAGWVDTPAGAGVLGVAVERLLAYRVDADRDGVAVMAGWTRRWHGPSLSGWWAQRRVELRTPRQGAGRGPARPGPGAGRGRGDRATCGRRGRGQRVDRVPLPARHTAEVMRCTDLACPLIVVSSDQ